MFNKKEDGKRPDIDKNGTDNYVFHNKTNLKLRSRYKTPRHRHVSKNRLRNLDFHGLACQIFFFPRISLILPPKTCPFVAAIQGIIINITVMGPRFPNNDHFLDSLGLN